MFAGEDREDAWRPAKGSGWGGRGEEGVGEGLLLCAIGGSSNNRPSERLTIDETHRIAISLNRRRPRFAADACFSRTAVINDRANAFAAAHLSLPPRPSPPPFGPRFTRVMGIDDHDTFTGLTPLQQACLDGNIEKVLELVDAGADVDIQANGEMAGKTAAMIAASEGSTDILKAMNRGPSLLNLKDADGGTAAMTAAVHKHGSVLDVRPAPRQDRSAEARSRPARAQPRRAPERPGSIGSTTRCEPAPGPPRGGRSPDARARRDARDRPDRRGPRQHARTENHSGFPQCRSDIAMTTVRYPPANCSRRGGPRGEASRRFRRDLRLLLPLLLPRVDILSPLLPLPPSRAAHREEGRRRPRRDGPGRGDATGVRASRVAGGGG